MSEVSSRDGKVADEPAVWSLAVGVSFLRNKRDVLNSAKLNAIYLVLASESRELDCSLEGADTLLPPVLYFCVTAIEGYGLGAVITQRIKLVRTYYYASAIAALVVVSAELLRVIVHFVDKASPPGFDAGG